MMKTCELETCASTFEAKRSDARFCGPTCRATASRLRRAASELATPPTAPPPSTSVTPPSPAVTSEPSTPPTERMELPAEASPLALLSGLQALGEQLARLERVHRQDQSTLRLLLGDMEEAEQLIQALGDRLKRLNVQSADDGSQEQLSRLERDLRQIQRTLKTQDARISAIDQSAAQALTLLSSML